MTTPRIQRLNDHVETEALSPVTTIHWNPTSNTGAIQYAVQRYARLTADGSYFGAPAVDGIIVVPLEVAMTETVEVQTEGGPVQVPLLLVAGAIKAHFAKHYALQREAAEEAPAEPAAE